MGNKTRPRVRKLKNRGGERLHKWWTLNRLGLVKPKSVAPPNTDCGDSCFGNSHVCTRHAFHDGVHLLSGLAEGPWAEDRTHYGLVSRRE